MSPLWTFYPFFYPSPLRKLSHLCNASPWPDDVLFWPRQPPNPLITIPTTTISPPTPSPLFLPISLIWSSLSLLSLYLSIYISFYPQILASPHILVSWWPATIYSWSLFSLYFRTILISPLCSDLLSIFLYTSFFSVFLHSASIVSGHYPHICLLQSVCSVSSLILSYLYAHAPLCFLRSVLIARIISAWIGSVWLSSLSSDIPFAPLVNIIFLQITYH